MVKTKKQSYYIVTVKFPIDSVKLTVYSHAGSQQAMFSAKLTVWDPPQKLFDLVISSYNQWKLAQTCDGKG